MGAASADAVYGLVAAFGLTIISDFLIQQNIWLQGLGGIFLCYLGVKMLLSNVIVSKNDSNSLGYLKSYLTTFFLTITNPMTILSFVAIFAGAGVTNNLVNSYQAVLLVLGVFLGSAVWWLFLSILAAFLREKMGSKMLNWVNRVSGAIILSFGLLMIGTLFYDFLNMVGRR